MSQNDFTIANQTFPNTRADINSALQALASTSSGSSAPSTTFANQLWYDTSANILYIRNEDNDGNIPIAELDQSNDTVEYFKSDSVRTALIEFTDGDDALTIADGGALTTASHLSIGGSNNELRFYEGANYVGFEAPALSADKIWVLPDADGSANQALVTNGSGTLSWATAGQSLRPNVKPLIINGAMAVAQRGTSTTGITGTGYHTIDRMKVDLSDNGTWTHTQDTDNPTGQGFAKSWKLDCTTADTSVASGSFHLARYLFEGQDLQLLKKGTSSAEKVTISFWIKATVTGTYIAELFDVDNSRQISQAYTITDSNTWEKKVLSFAGDTSGVLGNDNGSSFAINLWLGAGSDFTSGTLSTTWTSSTNANRAVGQVNSASSTSNNVYFTGLQMEVGEFTSGSLPSFQHEMYDDTLLRCHRYFIIGDNTANGLNPTAESASATTVQPTPQLRRTMRVAPTLTANPVGFIALIGGSGTTTTLIFSNMGQNGFRYGLNHNASITTQQNVAMGGLGADFDAEL